MPTAFSPSFASAAIHCESKFVCTRYPVKAVPIDARNATTPVTQVATRRPRQAAIQNLPHRWMTIVKKNSCTDQKWRLLKNDPAFETWYHCGPSKASTQPDTMITTSAAIVSTPKT